MLERLCESRAMFWLYLSAYTVAAGAFAGFVLATLTTR